MTENPKMVLVPEEPKARLRWIMSQGDTFAEMQEHCRNSDLYKHGDAVLVWVNEGDLHMVNIDVPARPSPKEGSDGLVERLTTYPMTHVEAFALVKEAASCLAALQEEVEEHRANVAAYERLIGERTYQEVADALSRVRDLEAGLREMLERDCLDGDPEMLVLARSLITPPQADGKQG